MIERSIEPSEKKLVAEFSVHGAPQGKARPRFSRRRGTVTTYTPQKTVDYEREVVRAYKSACGGLFFGEKIPLAARITAYFKPPKNTRCNVRQAMYRGDILPTKKPDADNIAKAICDALNGVAYHDDAQIIIMRVAKKYGEVPRVEVEIQMGGI